MLTPPRPSYRLSVFFVTGLLLSALLSVGLDQASRAALRPVEQVATLSEAVRHEPLAPRALTPFDREAAEVAWRYFEGNTRPETGYVDSVAGFPSTTLWDQGGYLLALLSAQKLGIISAAEFDDRVEAFLTATKRLPLFEGRLPNKVYDTRTLAMVNYANEPVAGGIGWSALDAARFILALRVLEKQAPHHGATIRDLMAAWDLEALARKGRLIGRTREAGTTATEQEGRVGYEQYAARATALWGLDTALAMSGAPILDWRRIGPVDVPVDRRDHSTFQAITPTLSEPWLLDGLELGLTRESMVLADRVYRAQEARFEETGLPTMVSEDHINQAPHFLYNSVFSNGRDWAVVTEDGTRHEALRTISTKAAFGWEALYGTDYADEVRRTLFEPDDLADGWPAGRFEVDGTANDILTLNTNAVILEAIHYKAFGPLWSTRPVSAEAGFGER